MSESNVAAIPKGSLVLVTGANGFIGSNIVKEFLERGYRVRGTVRDIPKNAFLTEEVFCEYARRGDFEVVEVPELGEPNAFDAAILGSGAAAIVHVASPLTFDPNPNNVVPQTVAGVVGILKAAAREPSVKQFVYTSSAPVAFNTPPGAPGVVAQDTWNDPVIQLAWAPPPYEPARGGITYLASKAEAEKAIWKFAEEEKPAFDINSVLPFTTLGKALHKSQLKGTSGWSQELYDGKVGMIATLPEPFHSNVRDVAVMHVAAVLDPDAKGQRFFAWAEPFNVNEILAALRRLYPDRQFIDDIPGKIKSQVTKDDSTMLALLKKWAGRDDWIHLDESVREGMEPVV